MAEHLNCKQSAANRPNHSMNGIPRGIDPRNLVGEKFEEVENAGNCDDPWIAEDLEGLILWRQRDPVKMDGQPSDENREIKVDPGQGSQPKRDSKKVKFLHVQNIYANDSVSRESWSSGSK